MKNLKILDKKALFSNLDHFSGHEICAMVKANAYGHGARQIVEIAEKKVQSFGVVSVEEGVTLREWTAKPILLCAKAGNFRFLAKSGLEFVVSSEQEIFAALECGIADKMHLKIDCGMNRYGVKDDDELERIDKLLRAEKIVLKSICTHFPDTENFKKTVKNYEIFMKKRKKIAQNAKICFGGSKIATYPFMFHTLRLGIGMYGYGDENLQPVMKIVSHVCDVKFVEKGEFVGYGNKFKVKKSGFFAVVPLGYADGLRRGLSGRFFVQINGTLYSSFGQICMDAFFVRVDAGVKVGDEVVVMWNAQEMAEKLDTISYEILTGFSSFRGETLIF